MIIKGASCAMHRVRLFTYPRQYGRCEKQTSIQAKEEMYMNIAVTDDTEDERRDGG